ncbi:hypothetical protein GALMADRAFT_245880 [Galerina marginata CBS 339.88]|uniref:Uncharacterized protein n=1 Tax=Galerina marginata (strain CBS 339.88) TaxID=685588 RepID=A0A067TCZ1_GALM3|nr:hypothetical protein GALMADRAFT_245880 [Galerina marginata CBS 339.88]
MRFLTLFLTAVTLAISVNAIPVAPLTDIAAARSESYTAETARLPNLQVRASSQKPKKPKGPYRTTTPTSKTGPQGQYLYKPTDARPNTNPERHTPRKANPRPQKKKA